MEVKGSAPNDSGTAKCASVICRGQFSGQKGDRLPHKHKRTRTHSRERNGIPTSFCCGRLPPVAEEWFRNGRIPLFPLACMAFKKREELTTRAARARREMDDATAALQAGWDLPGKARHNFARHFWEWLMGAFLLGGLLPFLIPRRTAGAELADRARQATKRAAAVFERPSGFWKIVLGLATPVVLGQLKGMLPQSKPPPPPVERSVPKENKAESADAPKESGSVDGSARVDLATGFTLRSIWPLFRDAGADFMKDNALRLSAALSYYSIFSLAPLLIIAIAIGSLVFGEDAVRGELNAQLTGYIGKGAAEAVESMVKSASGATHGAFAAIVGFCALLLGASGVFGQLKDALNSVWEVELRPDGGVREFIRNHILSFGMVLTVGFLLLISLVVSTLLAGMGQLTAHMVSVPTFVWTILNFVISLLVSSVLFLAIFKLLPDARIAWSTCIFGAVSTAILFELGKFLLAFYLGRESTSSGYGAAGSAVLILLWVYYASAILLFGAELTQVYARLAGHPVAPGKHAVSVGARADDNPAQVAEFTGKDLKPTS